MKCQIYGHYLDMATAIALGDFNDDNSHERTARYL